MADIRSTYPPGASQTNVTMDGRDPALYLQALIERERQVANRPPVFRAKPSGGGSAFGTKTRVQGRAGRGSEKYDPKFAHSWGAQQGAATRAVGLGFNMLPGYQADPRLLPPEMRPGASQFQAPTIGPSGAALVPGDAPLGTGGKLTSAVEDEPWQLTYFKQFGRMPGV